MSIETLQTIASEESLKHADDIDAAVDATMKRANRTRWFADLAEELTTRAVRAMVNDFRHAANVAARNENREYGGPASVTAGEAVNRVARSLYTYMIAGRTLGMLTGEELPTVAATEAATADGHRFNAKLCEALAPLVKADKTVRECVKESKLKKLFETLQ
jgi:acyl-CoA reductase-like NAD-dependent aldehyde dehydrogenase